MYLLRTVEFSNSEGRSIRPPRCETDHLCRCGQDEQHDLLDMPTSDSSTPRGKGRPTRAATQRASSKAKRSRASEGGDSDKSTEAESSKGLGVLRRFDDSSAGVSGPYEYAIFSFVL